MKRFYIIMCLTLLATFGAWAQVPQRNTKAYSYYEKAITGDAAAQTRLGNEFYHSKDFENAVYWYRKAAEQGNATAQNNLGICYEDGEGVTKDISEAVKWYRKAAAQGNIASKSMLKRLGYSESSGSSNALQASSSSQPRNKYSDFTGKIPAKGTKAYSYYEKAITGDAEAQNSLGDKYYNSKEYSSAVYWYRKAAEQGITNAQCNLGYCYEYGQGVTKSITEAIKLYRNAAEQGNAAAQHNLGECYEKGRGVTQNYYEAVKWYRKAADQGIAEAEYNLGVCHEKGQGVTKSISEAEKWYRKAAAQGNANAKDNLKRLSSSGSTGLQASSSGKNSSSNDKIPPKGTEAYNYYKQAILGKAKAQNKLGVCYEEGEGGVTKDSSEAVKWYRKAAVQGYAEAEYNLGRNFRGTERVKWYRKAAEQGHAEAQDRLGSCYESGEGVTKSLTEAFKWHRKAAEQGDAWAQYELGRCYEKGKGVNKNINEAVKWYRKSAENGNTFALEILANLGYSK